MYDETPIIGDWEPISYTKPRYVIVYENPDIMPATLDTRVFWSIFAAVEFRDDIESRGRKVFGIYLIGKKLK
jgi:hypothetical protein